MELLKGTDLNGVFMEILNAYSDDDDNFTVTIRISNKRSKSLKFKLDAKYISVDYGVKTCEDKEPSDIKSYGDGLILLPNSFADVKVMFEDIIDAIKGDRMIIDIEKYANLIILLGEQDEWFVVEKSIFDDYSKNLKTHVEHFEVIENKFGIRLQNFSIRYVNDHTIKVFCEVWSLEGKRTKDSFTIEVAIYDEEDNIIDQCAISKYNGEFTGFEVFNFGERSLDISLTEIGKIRFYPTE